MNRLEQSSAYRIYLVTVWQEQSADLEAAEIWRFRLEDPHTNQKRVFANPHALIVALKEGVLDLKEHKENERCNLS